MTDNKIREEVEKRLIKKEREAALKRSDKNLKAFLNNSLYAFLLVGDDYRIKVFNRTANEWAKITFGREMNEGALIYEFVFAELTGEFCHDFETVLAGEPVNVERKVRIIGDVEGWFEYRYDPVIDDDGKTDAFCMSFWEIDERKADAERIARSEERYRRFFEEDLTGDFIVTPRGELMDCNSAFAVMLGYDSTAQAKQKSPFMISENRGVLFDYLKQIRKNQKLDRYEHRLVRLDGESIEVIANVIGESNVETGMFQLRGYLFDITDRKRAEGLTQRLGRLVDSSLNEIYVFDVETGRFMLVNESGRANLGYTMDELSEMTPLDITEDVVKHEFEKYLRLLKDRKQELIDFEAVHLRKDGTTYPVKVYLQLSRLENPAVFMATIKDVTETEKFEKAKAMFLNAISHELRTPLTPIIGYAQLLLDGGLDDQSNIFVQQILKSAQRQQMLVEELIDIAQAEQGMVRYDFFENNAYQLLFTVAVNSKILVKKMVEDRYQRDDFEYRYDVSAALKEISVRVDSLRMQNVIENLIGNAVKYSPPDRVKIRFSARVEGNMVVVAVCDEGIGIAKNEWENIFRSFYQIRDRKLDVSDGIGQGLALVKRHVEGHGGAVKVQSEVGRGSCFTFSLPIYDVKDDDLLPLKPAKSVLVAGDDRQNVRFMTMILESLNLEVFSVMSEQQALRVLRGGGVALVILEVYPDLPAAIDSVEILKEIYDHRDRPSIVLCSDLSPQKVNYWLHQKISLSLDFSGIEFLSKPLDKDELIHKVQRLVKGIVGQEEM